MHTGASAESLQHIVQNTLHKFPIHFFFLFYHFSLPHCLLFPQNLRLYSLSLSLSRQTVESKIYFPSLRHVCSYVNKHDRAKERRSAQAQEKTLHFFPHFLEPLTMPASPQAPDNFILQFHNSFDLLFHPNWTRIYWMCMDVACESAVCAKRERAAAAREWRH